MPPAEAEAYTFVDDGAVAEWQRWTLRQQVSVGVALLVLAVVLFGALAPLGDRYNRTSSPSTLMFPRPAKFPLPLTQTRSDAPFTDEAKTTVANAIDRTRGLGTASYEHFADVEGERSRDGQGDCLDTNRIRLSDGDIDFDRAALRQVGGVNRNVESIVAPGVAFARRTGPGGVVGPWHHADLFEPFSLEALRELGGDGWFLNEWIGALPIAALTGLLGPDSVVQPLDADVVAGVAVARFGVRSGQPEPKEASAERPVWVVSIDAAGLIRQVSLHHIEVLANGTANPKKGWLRTPVDVVRLHPMPGVPPIEVPAISDRRTVNAANPVLTDDAAQAERDAARAEYEAKREAVDGRRDRPTGC